MEKNFDGIALVAGGLLKVSAIRQDLSFALLQEDLDPLLLPSSPFAKVRKNDPCVQESQGFTGEVGVGRRVGREIPFDMRRMDPDSIEHHLIQLGSQRLGTTKQSECPAPGDEAQGHFQTAGPVDSHA